MAGRPFPQYKKKYLFVMEENEYTSIVPKSGCNGHVYLGRYVKWRFASHTTPRVLHINRCLDMTLSTHLIRVVQTRPTYLLISTWCIWQRQKNCCYQAPTHQTHERKKEINDQEKIAMTWIQHNSKCIQAVTLPAAKQNRIAKDHGDHQYTILMTTWGRM
jgi:hypothetical protein